MFLETFMLAQCSMDSKYRGDKWALRPQIDKHCKWHNGPKYLLLTKDQDNSNKKATKKVWATCHSWHLWL